jgi:hypothetical protein
MSDYTDTFKPVDVTDEKDELGRPIDRFEEVSTLGDTPTPEATPVPKPEVTETPKETPSWFNPTYDEKGQPLKDSVDVQTREALPDEQPAWFNPAYDEAGQPLSTGEAQSATLEEDTGSLWNFLPEGVEAQSYTVDDFYTNDKLMEPIMDHMEHRRGSSWVKKHSKEEVIDAFVQERRSTSSGNSVRGLADYAYLKSIGDDADKLRSAAEAYSVFDNTAGAFSEGSSWSNAGQAAVDYVQGVLLDPVNLVTLGWGKLVTGGGSRITGEVVKREGIREFQRVLAAQAAKKVSSEAALKAARKAGNATMTRIVQEGSEKAAASVVNRKAAQALAAKNGVARLAQTSALKDIAGTVAIDGVVNAGMEALHQGNLIELGVRDDVDELAIGLAFVGGAVIGGVQAARIMSKGVSGVKLPSLEVQKPTTKNLMTELTKALKVYSDDTIPKSGTWSQKVEAGKDVRSPDTEFFQDLLLGRSNADTGEVYFKGLAQLTSERGLIHIKTSKEDLYSDWIADILKDASPGEIDDFVSVLKKNFKMNFKELDGISPEDFGNLFARKASESASSLGAIGRAAKSSLNQVDVSKMDVGSFIDKALDTGWGSGAVVGKMGKLVADYQGRVVRLLVAHPATSALNMSGYAGGAAFNTVSDLSQALLHVGHGTMKSIVGSAGAKSELDSGFGILRAVGNRARLLLDNRATGEAFEDYLNVRSQFLGDLADITSGGVEQTTKNLFDGKLSPTELMIGSRVDSVVEGLQRLTFVQGQDAVTKSQEFMYQIDKALRTTGIKLEDGTTLRFKGGYNEFFNAKKNPDVAKLLRTKQYREMEAGVVNRTLEGIFSKSHKGKDVIGEVAAVIEDARKLPGIGLMVPFGRFFNNTVSFSTASTPLGLVMKAMGKYDDRSFKEVFSKALVGTTLIYTMADRESELRNLGLAIGQDIDNTGEVIDVKFDYPASHFKYAARIVSYHMDGLPVPKEIITQYEKQFGLGGLTKNLTTTQNDLVAVAEALIGGDTAAAWKETKSVLGKVGAQVAAAATRPIGAVNTAVGIMNRDTYITPDRRQGLGHVANTALRNLDQISLLLTGKEPVQKYSSAQGAVDVQPTALIGARTLNLTHTERMLNNVGIEPYTLNVAVSIANKAPESANRYHNIFFAYINDKAKYQWESRGFADLPEAHKKLTVDSIIADAKKYAEAMLYVEGSRDPNNNMNMIFNLHKSNSEEDVNWAAEQMGLQDVGEATAYQLAGMQALIDGKDTMDYLAGVRGKQ